MSIFGGIIAADDEVSNVGRKIVLVDATELGNLLGNVCLFKEEVRSALVR
jgi:hypothetical protein